jgi:hypothetical protein
MGPEEIGRLTVAECAGEQRVGAAPALGSAINFGLPIARMPDHVASLR